VPWTFLAWCISSARRSRCRTNHLAGQHCLRGCRCTSSCVEGVVTYAAHNQGLPTASVYLLDPRGWFPASLALEVLEVPDVVYLDVHRWAAQLAGVGEDPLQ
jgi:hypothetical protein